MTAQQQSYDDDTAARLRQLRATERMQATKARQVVDKHDANAAALTIALVAMGAETPDTEPSS